ncbi:C40 family peptidase [Alicyclobacillus kakegawensis]|uniref:C40 family peptidase n=1 Tax=Alicyclobacillus kakegawensis TaxID=392012 RepID=UPI000ACA47C8|nr:C40 family peptidase [Alicyclobacillus kakegawensis]
MRLRKQLMVSLSGALVAVSVLVPQVKADNLSDKQQRLNQLRSQADQVSSEIARQRAKANAIQSKIDDYQAHIDSMNQQIEASQRQVDEIRGKLDRLMNQMAQNQKQLTEDRQKLREMLRAAYEYGQVPYLQVLFKATSWDDLLTRLQALSQVSRTEKQLADQVAALQAQLQEQQRAQEASFQQLKSKVQRLQELRDQNLALQNEQKQSLSIVSRGLDLQELRRAQLQDQIGMTQSEIQELKQEAQRSAAEASASSAPATGGNSAGGGGASQTPAPTTSTELPSGNGSEIAVYAESFIGHRYVWGAAGPNSFDCSGLVMYVYNRFGISLPHSSYAQFGMGTPVAKSDLRAGDLVFFSTDGGGASHVGIYIGNGEMVSAQSPSSGVREANITSGYWANAYIGARRIVH